MISFFRLLPLHCTVSNAVNCEWGRLPHISPTAPFAPATWLLQCPWQDFTIHVTIQSNGWIRPELHRNTLKTTSGKNHLSGDVFPGTSCASGNPLGSYWRGWRGLHFILTLHSPPKTQTKVRKHQGEPRKATLAIPFPPWFPKLCNLSASKRMDDMENFFLNVFKQQKHVSAFLEHILFAIKNVSTFHNLPRHRNDDKKSQLKVFYKSFCGWAVLISL